MPYKDLEARRSHYLQVKDGINLRRRAQYESLSLIGKQERNKACREYYVTNSIKILAQKKTYYDDNREIILDKKKQRRQYASEHGFPINWSWNLMRSYGITGDEYIELHAAQRGLCAICHEPEIERTKSGHIKMLAVDHNHATGKVRALLCARHNKGLGHFNDSVELLRAALVYLEVHNETSTG